MGSCLIVGGFPRAVVLRRYTACSLFTRFLVGRGAQAVRGVIRGSLRCYGGTRVSLLWPLVVMVLRRYIASGFVGGCGAPAVHGFPGAVRWCSGGTLHSSYTYQEKLLEQKKARDGYRIEQASWVEAWAVPSS